MTKLFRQLEFMLILLILLFGFWIRIVDLDQLPAGLSSEEITSLRIVESIEDNRIITVFIETDHQGIESFYHLSQVVLTTFFGDGQFSYRMFSVYCNLIALALLYALTRRLFGRTVAVVATISMTLGIWPILVARTVSHVSLVNVAVLSVLWFASRAYYLSTTIRPERPKTMPYIQLALAITFAVYTHFTGIWAAVGIILFILYLYYTQQPISRLAWWNSGFALNLAGILSLPYLISVLRAPTSTGFHQFWENRPASIWDFIDSLGRTILAFFFIGDKNPAHNIPGIPLLSTPEFGVIMLVGIMIAAIRWRYPNYTLVLIFFTLGLLPDIWLKGGPDYTALAFLNPLIYIFVGIGIVETFRILRENTEPPERLAWVKNWTFLGKWPQPLIRVIALILVLSFARYGWLLQQRFFTDWSTRSDTEQAYSTSLSRVAAFLDDNNGDIPVLICTGRYQPVDVNHFEQPLSTPQIINLMSEHDNEDYRVADCPRDMVMVNAGNPMYVLFINPSDFSTMPASLRQWLSEDSAELIEHPMLEAELLFLLNAEQQIVDKGGELQRNSILFYPREPGQEEAIAAVHPVRFGGNITLLGYEMLNHDEPLQPGAILPIVTYWRIDGPTSPNTGVFIRLHDTPQASPYTEINQFNVLPDRLQPRDIVVQINYLTLPETLRPQEYILTLGVFDYNPTNQFPVYDDRMNANGAEAGNYIVFDNPFTVVAP